MATILHFGGGGSDVSAATAAPGDVLSGETFFGSGSDDIQTGTLAFSGDAVAADVLAPKTFYSNSGTTKRTGTMPAKTGTTKTLNYAEGVAVASGYYAAAFTLTAPGRYGNATAAQVLNGLTFMNTAGNQTGTIISRTGTTKTLNSAEAVTVTNGYYATSFTLTAPTATSITGNATAAQVLSGYTFMNSSGSQQTGTIAARSITNATLGYGANIAGSAGHYAAAFTITAPGRYGNATAGQVLTGYTFMNSTANSTGTMPSRGALTATYSSNGAYAWVAGYYTAGTITVSVGIPAGYVKMTTGTVSLNSSWTNITHNFGTTPSVVLVGYTYSNTTWPSGTLYGLKHQNVGTTVFAACEQGSNSTYKTCRWACW